MRAIVFVTLLLIIGGCSGAPTPTPPKGVTVKPSPTIPASYSMAEEHAVEGCTEYLTLVEAARRASRAAKTDEEQNLVNRVVMDKVAILYDGHLQYVVPAESSDAPKTADASYKEMQLRLERDQWFLKVDAICASIMN